MTQAIDATELRRQQAKAMREVGRDGLQQQVMDRLKEHGWQRVYHTYSSKKSAPGFPDIIALRDFDGSMMQLVVELKREGQWPTPDQQDWLDWFSSLDTSVSETHLWFPTDLLDGTVDEVLQGRYVHRSLWTTRKTEREATT